MSFTARIVQCILFILLLPLGAQTIFYSKTPIDSQTLARKKHAFPEMDMQEKMALNTRFELGNYLVEMQNYAQAEMEFNKLLPYFPEDRKLLSILGACQLMLEKMDSAEINLLHALQLDSNNTMILNLLSRVYLSQHREGLAIQMLEQSLNYEPSQISLRLLLCQLLVNSNDFSKAEPQVKLLFQANDHPINAEAHYLWGNIYTKRGQLPEALLQYQKAYVQQPHSDIFLLALASAYQRVHQYKAALPLWQKKMELEAQK